MLTYQNLYARGLTSEKSLNLIDLESLSSDDLNSQPNPPKVLSFYSYVRFLEKITSPSFLGLYIKERSHSFTYKSIDFHKESNKIRKLHNFLADLGDEIFIKVLDTADVDIDDLEPTAIMHEFYDEMCKEDLFEKILRNQKKTGHASIGDLLIDEVPLLFNNTVKTIPDENQNKFKSELKTLLNESEN